MSFDPTTSDRDADEYELRLHRKSATRGFLVGGALSGVASAIFLLTGVVYVGMLLVPGILLLLNAWTHREKGNALAARLASGASAYARGPAARASAEPTLGRGSRVVISWTDGAQLPGFVLQLRGQHYFVELDDGRQEWIPVQHVRAG